MRDQCNSSRLANLLAASLLSAGIAAAQGNPASELRSFIGRQSGGIEKLMVPANDSDLPQPLLSNGMPDPRFRTTEAKRYLGKQLYFDPVRTARILPEFGGVLATRQTGSCGSCHLGEAAGKSGTLMGFGVGGEGRGYTDAQGNFIPRRRAQQGLLDTVPTLTDIFEFATGNPGRARRIPASGRLIQSGQLDAVDVVPRSVPSMIGFAFNTRLLQGGFAGESDSFFAALNPDGFSPGENLTQLTLAAHRMVDFQAAELQKVPVYRQLFREAFPTEAAMADSRNDLNLLINDETVIRAMATFLRTVVTRNTPWDRFLAGDDSALSTRQQRGARLFFTQASADSAANRGAGCYSCHSGPMLNKQAGDEAGLLVEENFYNLGTSDHPLQALNAQVLRNPRHRDIGRMEITSRESDRFKFRVPTLRQVKDARFFFHGGSFSSVRDVVRYFNAGVAQDAEAGSVPTFTSRFSFPRGPYSARGLGLDDADIDDLTDFLENGLHDPAFVRFDPRSTTRTFEPNEQDLTYSTNHPRLTLLGAIDGRMASGLARSNNDALSRRDQGLEFLDVTSQLGTVRVSSNTAGPRQQDSYRMVNSTSTAVDTHLLIVVRGLPKDVQLENASGMTSSGDPYVRVFLTDGILPPGQSFVNTLVFRRPADSPPVGYTLRFLSGQGNP